MGTILTVGTTVASSRRAIELAEAHQGILAAVGIHPHDAAAVTEADVDEIERLAEHPRVVAIGEIGLDFYRHYSPRERQLDALRWQLHVASRRGLPVIIHAREAHDEMLDVLGEWLAWHGTDPVGTDGVGVIHCFMGDTATAGRYLEMGFMISLAAYVGYPASRDSYDVIRGSPSDRLLVETDCPYLAPEQLRGRRNEPAYVRHTAEALAGIRGVPLEAVARETTNNARRLFGR